MVARTRLLVKLYEHCLSCQLLNLLSPPSLYITLVNTQNVSVTKIVDSSSIQRAETKYGLRIQFLVIVVTIHEFWLNA